MRTPPEPNLSGGILRWRARPEEFVRQALGVEPEPWQRDALRAIATHDRIAIRSGHGVGKSAYLSWLILWWLATRFPAKVPCTAATSHQLDDVLWSELAIWHRRMPAPLAAQFEWRADRFFLRGAAQESFAVARTARNEQPEAFQGFHAGHLLFLVDEASGVPDAIFEAGQGSMSTKGAKTVIAGNPTRPQGYFFRAFHDQRARWHCLRVNSEDVPRAGGHIEDVAATYGRDSNAYRIRVLGEFPTSADEQVIALDLLEAAIAREVQPLTQFKPVWGVDVARFGADRTALAKRQGNILLAPVQWWRGKDTMQVAGLIAHEWAETAEEDRPSEILVDVIGIGAGVTDRLIELGLPARGVNVGEAPAVDARFVALRDELWWRGRDWFAGRDCAIPPDGALIADLSAPSYAFTSKGKLKIESKDALKRRGMPSPDLADAFLLTFAGGLDRHDESESRYRPRKATGSWMTA